jgi:hypothetical protein
MLRVMWGDPPKPNMWKATVRELKTGWKAYTIQSPALRHETIFITLEKSTSEGISLVAVYGAQGSWKESLYAPTEDLDDGEAVLSHAFWSTVKRMLVKHNELKTPNKVASSKIELQWGNPPKPNIWKASYDEYELSLTVDSPLIERPIRITAKDFRKNVGGTKYLKVQIHTMDRESYLWELQVYYYSELLEFNAGATLTHAAEAWFEKVKSREGWKEISSVIRIKPRSGSTKIASDESPIEVMWGDPPKPNMWKATLSRSTTRSRTYEIVSPVLKQTLKIKILLEDPLAQHTTKYVILFLPWGLQRPLKEIQISHHDRSFNFETVFTPYFWKRYISPTLLENNLIKGVKKIASKRR